MKGVVLQSSIGTCFRWALTYSVNEWSRNRYNFALYIREQQPNLRLKLHPYPQRILMVNPAPMDWPGLAMETASGSDRRRRPAMQLVRVTTRSVQQMQRIAELDYSRAWQDFRTSGFKGPRNVRRPVPPAEPTWTTAPSRTPTQVQETDSSSGSGGVGDRDDSDVNFGGTAHRLAFPGAEWGNSGGQARGRDMASRRRRVHVTKRHISPYCVDSNVDRCEYGRRSHRDLRPQPWMGDTILTPWGKFGVLDLVRIGRRYKVTSLSIGLHLGVLRSFVEGTGSSRKKRCW